MKTLFFVLITTIPLLGFYTPKSEYVKGYVFDVHTKHYISGVKVYYKDTPDKESITNNKGFFKINSNKNEEVLVFSASGYQRKELKANAKDVKVYLVPQLKQRNDKGVVSPKIQELLEKPQLTKPEK